MFRAVYTTLYYVVFSVIILITGLLLVSLFPIEGNYQVKVVLSGSMEPDIHTGSVVFIKPEPTYQVGDVITFGEDTRNRVPVTHRIIEAEASPQGTVFTTKGDANSDPDAQGVAVSEVIGKVVFTLPFLGYVLEFVKQPYGFLTLIVVPAALIAVGEIRTIVREVRGIKKQNVSESVATVDTPHQS